MIYADFESILEKIDTVSPNPNKSYTNKCQKHTPCGFCYYIRSSVGDEYNKLEIYRGEDASEEFLIQLEKDCIRLREIMVKTYKPMSLTKGEKKEFRKNKSGDGDGSRAMYTVRVFYFLTFEGTPRANWRESGKT